MTHPLRSAFAIALGLMAYTASTHAATYNWSSGFGDCNPTNLPNGAVVANAGAWSNALNACTTPTVSPSAGAPAGSLTVNVRGTSVSADGTGLFNGTVYSYGSSGLGVVNTDGTTNANGSETTATGPHSTDSAGRIDGIVLQFSRAVDLDAFTIGWNGTDNPTTDSSDNTYTDSDISVYAWNGTGAAPTAYDKKSSSGWTLVGTYYDVGASNNTATTIVGGGGATVGGTTTSSYWLISALGSSSAEYCNVDAFKLLSVAGTYGVTTPPPSGVPEPGSLALLGLGALGLIGARRKSVTHS